VLDVRANAAARLPRKQARTAPPGAGSAGHDPTATKTPEAASEGDGLGECQVERKPVDYFSGE
jgi:hypothetical protein